jgi:hypothetical protein
MRDGIGGLLSPWQIRREGRARAEVRAEEMVRLAQADEDIADIRAGRKRIDARGNLVAVSREEESAHGFLDPRIFLKNLTMERFCERPSVRSTSVESRSQQKRRRAAQKIARWLPDRPDPDWLSKWRLPAQDVSNEKMQQLWARLLSGELKQPGTYSFHAVELLSRLSSADARIKITRVGGQLLSLGKFKSNERFLKFHAKHYMDKRLRVRLADITARSGDVISFANAQVVS